MRNLLLVPIVLAFLFISGSTVWGAETAIQLFSRTHARYLKLTGDPAAGRDQWLEVIRSFVAVQRKGSIHIKSKSLFLAGRASLTLYGRDGNIEDLDNAIRYFNEVKRITRHDSRLPAILRELRTAHQLRRTHASALRRVSQPPMSSTAAPIILDERSVKASTWTTGVAGRGGRQGWLDRRPHLSTGRMPAPPDATKRQDSRVASNIGDTPSPTSRAIQKYPHPNPLPVGEGTSGFGEPRDVKPNTSRHTKLSDVYQGNPFYPVGQTEPSYSAPPAKADTLPEQGPLPGRDPSPHSPQPGKTVSVPSRVLRGMPAVAPDPPRRRDNRKPFVIVIDPGHGGKDPGALSPNGSLKEKDITLYVSQRLKKRLEEHAPGIKVELTRTDDSFLTLTQRTAAANSFNADMFISIHCNSYPDASAEGIETYYLSKAGSERAMRVAARENDIPLARMSDVEATLLDLMMTSKKSESEKLAETVHEGLAGSASGKSSAGRNRGVKRGPFYVLLGATMPAILVECGYISSVADSRRLGNKRYLDSIAGGIASGAHTYLKGLGSAGN